ncbi:hypothetical protein ccbrp13_23970 [Ktedonobacteria bacterium brp13]|nr:hypothetical protein ccbrp13_23970 [Ktedonobacteria bacterium brp13]
MAVLLWLVRVVGSKADPFMSSREAPGQKDDLLSTKLALPRPRSALVPREELNVVNNIGGSSTSANPDVPVTVVSYP